MMCTCDEGYHGETCVSNTQLPGYLKEGFPLADSSDDQPEVLHELDTFGTRKFRRQDLPFVSGFH